MKRTISRKERDQHRRRVEILQVAKEIFITCGFEGATMQEIATRSEFPLASVYKYFESKENLFQVLTADFVQGFLTKIEQAAAGVDNPLEKIKSSIRACIDNLEKEKKFSHLLVRNLRGLWSPGEGIQTANLAYRAFFSYFEGLFKQARAMGNLSDVEPSEAALCLIGMLYIKLVYSILVDPDKPIDADSILRVVLGPIEAPSAAQS